MKHVKVLFIIVFLFFLTTTLSAQFQSWSKLMSFNANYALLKGEVTGNTLDGYAFDFTYEQVNSKGDMAGGILIAYLAGHDDDTENERRINYQSLPIYLQGKYLFGSESIMGYLQGGIGLQFSRIEFTGPNLLQQDGDSGFAFNLGLGGYFFTDEKIFINAAYNFNYLVNSFYQDGMVHMIKVGIGFQSI